MIMIESCGIRLTEVHVVNIKSIREAFVRLGYSNYVFGLNNAGKSNLLFAIQLALGNRRFMASDVYSSNDEPYSREKEVYVDLRFELDEGDIKRQWMRKLGNVLTVDGQFCFRTELIYDEDNGTYRRNRCSITEWNGSAIKANRNIRLSEDVMRLFGCYYIEAHRDISEDVYDRGSLWNREVSKVDISEEIGQEVRETIRSINTRIVKESQLLSSISEALGKLNESGNLYVDPLPSEVSDIYRGLDIKVDEGGNIIPISSVGLGTRSIAAITTAEVLSKRSLGNSLAYMLLMVEEPEAHLHPQLQSDIGRELSGMKVQSIVTTHSPYVLAEGGIANLINCKHGANGTEYIRSNVSNREKLKKVEERIRRYRPAALFARVVVLVEGRTEELFLPPLICSYFGKTADSLGFTVLDVGGTGYRQFIDVFDSLGIEWVIFSDGEEKPLRKLNEAVADWGGSEKLRQGDSKRIVVIPDGLSIEGHICMNMNDVVTDFLKEYDENVYRKKLCNLKNDDVVQANIDVLKTFKVEYSEPLANYICDNADVRALPAIMELMELLERRSQHGSVGGAEEDSRFDRPSCSGGSRCGLRKDDHPRTLHNETGAGS